MTRDVAIQAQSRLGTARIALEAFAKYFEQDLFPLDTYLAKECYGIAKVLQDVSNLLQAEFLPMYSLPEDASLDVISSYVEKRMEEVPF